MHPGNHFRAALPLLAKDEDSVSHVRVAFIMNSAEVPIDNENVPENLDVEVVKDEHSKDSVNPDSKDVEEDQP